MPKLAGIKLLSNRISGISSGARPGTALMKITAGFTLLTTLGIAQAQPIKVLFWGGLATTPHNSRPLRDTLEALFAANNMHLFYRDAASPTWLHPDSLAQFDVALLYTTNQTGTDLTAGQLTALTNWVASGRVIVAMHGSTNTYLNNGTVSTAWRELLGAQFVDHDSPNHAGTCTFTRPNHLALFGTTPLPASAMAEPAASNTTTYGNEGRRHGQYVADTVVLARAQLGTTNVPWIWVRPQGQGWIYYNASGHNFRTWARPEWKGQIVRALTWGYQIRTTGIRGKAALEQLRQLTGGADGMLRAPFNAKHSIEILDMQGRTRFLRVNSYAPTYDLSFLPAGTYGVRILSKGHDAYKGLYLMPR